MFGYISFFFFTTLFLFFLKRYFNGGVCRYTADLTGKTIIITGANSGLGLHTTSALSKLNAKIIMACRDVTKAEEVKEKIQKSSDFRGKLDIMPLDLSKTSSIRAFAREFLQKYDTIDILINNAGIMISEQQFTEKGLDLMMATNYFGVFLLTTLLLGALKNSKASRIINLTSIMNFLGYLNVKDFNCEKLTNKITKHLQIYGGTKLGLIAFTKELAEKLRDSNVKTCCVHPGIVRTKIVETGTRKNDIFMKTLLGVFPFVWWFFTKNVQQGCQGILHCALIPHELLSSGAYYIDCKETVPWRNRELTKEFRKELWETTEEIVKSC